MKSSFFAVTFLAAQASEGGDTLEKYLPDGAVYAIWASAFGHFILSIRGQARSKTQKNTFMSLGIRFSAGATFVAYLLTSLLAQQASGETNVPPTVRIGAPYSGSVYQAPANITIFAQPNDVDGTVETVEFFEGTNSLGVVTNGPAVMSAINPWHLFWTNVPVGTYPLRAKATDDQGAVGWSEPVRVYVVESTNRPAVVNVVASDPDAEEIPVVPPGMGLMQRDNPAVFTIRREGDTNNPLTVYFHLGGTASNGVDYVKVGDSATIAAGALSADVVIDPIDDFLVEGTETVVLTLDPVACPAIFPPPPGCYELGALRSAVAYIRDNDTISNLPPKVAITDPTNGQSFAFPATIPIQADVTDPDGYSSFVEFFANGRKIGEETIDFFVEPPPGQTFTFSFDWSGAEPGLYELVARATDNLGGVAASAPVRISVTGTNFPPPPINLPPIVTITATDAFAAEGTNCWGATATDPVIRTNPVPCGPNTATFVVRRSGPTNSDLTVVYGIGGSASNGVDYVELPGFVTIPAGERRARIVVTPIDDTEVEGPETVVLSLQIPPSPLAVINPPPPYVIGFPGKAAAVIADNDGILPPTRCLSDGLFHACWEGTNGFCYRVEISTNLINWLPVCTNSVTDGGVHFVDPDTLEFRHRFYRAVPEPCVAEP